MFATVVLFLSAQHYNPYNNFNLKCQENPEETPQPRRLQSEDIRREQRPSPSISTESWSKCIQRPVSPRDPCPSWTPSSTTSSRKSPMSLPNSWDITRNILFHPERSKPQLDSSSQESLPSTPSLREPRLSPNTQATESEVDINYVQTSNNIFLN